MNHEPDPQFLEHLEWQVRTAVQRHERFATPVASTGLRWARTALLVGVSLLGGAGAVIAAEHYQDEQQKEFLVARARIELEMATLELEFARRELERVESLTQMGAISTEERIESAAHVGAATDLVQERRLDLEEIQLTGQEPRRDLGAPLVGDRDFVKEHLDLELLRTKHVLEPLREHHTLLKVRYESGLVPQSELYRLDHELVMAEAAASWATRRLELRAGFIAGEYTLEQLNLLELEGEHAQAVTELGRRLVILRRQVEVQNIMQAEGRSAPNARFELELQLLEKTLQLRRLELKRVRARLGK